MTSTNERVGGVSKEVDYQKLGPSLLIAPSLVLAIRTARWPTTHSDGLAEVDWQKEVEHSVRIAKAYSCGFVSLSNASLNSTIVTVPSR
jgi:hypothetical protein